MTFNWAQGMDGCWYHECWECESVVETAERVCAERRPSIARENDAHDEAKAEAYCAMGTGCGMTGVCYAEKMGSPDMCTRVGHNAVFSGADKS